MEADNNSPLARMIPFVLHVCVTDEWKMEIDNPRSRWIRLLSKIWCWRSLSKSNRDHLVLLIFPNDCCWSECCCLRDLEALPARGGRRCVVVHQWWIVGGAKVYLCLLFGRGVVISWWYPSSFLMLSKVMRGGDLFGQAESSATTFLGWNSNDVRCWELIYWNSFLLPQVVGIYSGSFLSFHSRVDGFDGV